MCAELLPEVSPAIPRSLLAHARRAAQACPALALLIEKKTGKHR
jgi:ferredoxin